MWRTGVLLVIGMAGCGGQAGASGPTTGVDGGMGTDATAGQDGAPAVDGESGLDASTGFDAPPADSLAPHPGEGGIGDPCSSDEDCANEPGTPLPAGLCLGPPFGGGYCTVRIPECPASPPDSGFPCPAGSVCSNAVITVVDDGGTNGDFCLKVCSTPSDCRSGYTCCHDMLRHLVCQPPGECSP